MKNASDQQTPTPTDMDAYWLDGGKWRHCQTGAMWSGNPLTIEAATDAFCAMLERRNSTLPRERDVPALAGE